MTALKESLRDQSGFPMLESILYDVRYAARSLVRQPGVTVLAAGILALGLGLTRRSWPSPTASCGARCRTRPRTNW